MATVALACAGCGHYIASQTVHEGLIVLGSSPVEIVLERPIQVKGDALLIALSLDEPFKLEAPERETIIVNGKSCQLNAELVTSSRAIIKTGRVGFAGSDLALRFGTVDRSLSFTHLRLTSTMDLHVRKVQWLEAHP